MNALHAIPVADLPPLAYLYGENHDPALTEPEHFRAITSNGWVKPSGGLWTAPITARADDGSVLRTAWTEWCVDNMWADLVKARFLEILPRPDARVLLVDAMDDLQALVAAFPNTEPRYRLRYGHADQFPNWQTMAACWDAVYLTDAGQWATRLPPYGEPNLYTWDCASVLWLRPAYSVAVSCPTGGAR